MYRRFVSSGIFCFLFFALTFNQGIAQGDPDYQGGLRIPLSQDGSKYFRLLGWGQIWGSYDEPAPANQSHLSFSIRRARGIFYSQLNNRFLFLTHVGLNSINHTTLHPVGKGDGSQIFLHGLWGEYTVVPTMLHIGAGLHYWNGISRLNSQSTLNMLTLDNHRTSWATLGLSDQFARHLGVYFKGGIGNFSYRFAISDAISTTLDAGIPVVSEQAVYRGKELLGKPAQFSYHGYLEYHFGEKESSFLPYKVGSYLGSKRVITLGGGFFSHPNGSVGMVPEGNMEGQNVFHYAFDLFMDLPLHDAHGTAITAYLSFTDLDYGKDYLLKGNSTDIGTGQVIYGHIGYLLPEFIPNSKLQPYISYSYKDFDGLDRLVQHWGVGNNWYIQGHHAKISLEYRYCTYSAQDSNEHVILQAMVYL
jgi:hypothetical protein